MIEEFGKDYVTVSVPTLEHGKVLMLAAELLGCVVQKYYWRSILDPDSEYIEEIEPMCPDAFEVIINIKGETDTLNDLIQFYKEKVKQLKLDELPSMLTPYTEDEIKQTAYKMIASL